MANKIILKKSSVAAKVPLATDLDVGELAVNLADAKLYSKNASGAVIQLGGSSGGGGDVTGPTSATDNALARFDGTTGKLIQNSGVRLDDNDNVLNPRSVQLSGDVPATPPPGTLWFDSTTDTLNLQQNAITQQIGEEIYVYGKASSAISGETILQAIYKTGTVGSSGVIQFAPTVSGITDGGLIIGVGTEDIATNSFGRVTNFGIVHGINTTGSTYGETWADGDEIWYKPSTGGLTKTKPSAPSIKVQIGTVINAGSGGSGSFQVLLNAGSSLGGTDDNVQITSPISGNALVYDATAGYWKNANITAGTGIGVTNGAGSITISNSGVTSIAGTANQVTASASTGGVTLSLPATINVNTSGNAATATSAGSATTATNVSGTVAIANGGTGQTTKAAAYNALSPITTTGDLVIGNGANSATRLAIGTNGQVLTSNGTTASWAAAGGGDFTLVSTQTVSGVSNVEFTGLTGKSYFLKFSNFYCSSLSNNWMYVIVGYGSTPTYLTSGYTYETDTAYSGGGYVNNYSRFEFTNIINSSENNKRTNGFLYLNQDSSAYVQIIGTNRQCNYGPLATIAGTCTSINGNDLTSIKVAISGGTFTGTVSLYKLGV